MKKYTLILANLFILIASSYSQDTFTTIYTSSTHESGHDIIQTINDEYVIIGTTKRQNSNVRLIKISSSGEILLTKTYFGGFSDYGYRIKEIVDEGFIIGGSTLRYGFPDIYIIKTDYDGNVIWEKTYGGTDVDAFGNIQLTPDGGFIICGHTYSFGSGFGSIYLIKTDSHGDSQWEKIIEINTSSWGKDVLVTSDGGYLITGSSESHAILVKTNSLGDTIWSKTYDFFDPNVYNNSKGYSVIETLDQGYLIAGNVSNYTAPVNNIFLIKTDLVGDTLWTKTFGYNPINSLGGLTYDSKDEGYIISGTVENTDSDVYLVKVDSLGENIWTKSYDLIQEDWGSSVKITSDGGYIITGVTGKTQDKKAVFCLKVDNMGNYNPDIEIITSDLGYNYNPNWNIFPNPTNGLFSIQVTEAYFSPNEIVLTIFDLNGRSILSKPLSDVNTQLNLETLERGVYILNLTSNEYSFETRKLIKY